MCSTVPVFTNGTLASLKVRWMSKTVPEVPCPFTAGVDEKSWSCLLPARWRLLHLPPNYCRTWKHWHGYCSSSNRANCVEEKGVCKICLPGMDYVMVGPSSRLPLWSSGQSFWLQIQRSRVRFLTLPDFLSSSGSGTGSTQPREVNWGATWIKSSGSGPENRD